MQLQYMSLASGSSGNCCYLGTEEYGILIDAGISIRSIKKILKDNNISIEHIVALLITHDHADHIKAAGHIGEKMGIPVYTTSTILNGMNRNYCMAEKIYSAHREIVKEIPFKIRDFEITAFEVPHDGSDNVGYSIRYHNHTFVLATDMGHITETAARYLSQANYLVIEANYDATMLQNGPYPLHLKRRIVAPRGHMDNAETAEFLATTYHTELTHIFLCHLSLDNNHPQLAYKTIENRLYNEGIRVGKDVELVTLARNHASQLYCFEK
ncbi:MAG: MBL fold metallo-hydrolase [Bacteroidaceae bacterium]|nr:MBL fold metallo-hydrolase [Bacteroidaceae bacterium]